MKLPRDVSGDELGKRLGKLGYEITRQTGSHIRLAYYYYPRKAQPVRKICRLSSTEKELLTSLNLEIPEVK